jgi:hypothetical protein
MPERQSLPISLDGYHPLSSAAKHALIPSCINTANGAFTPLGNSVD